MDAIIERGEEFSYTDKDIKRLLDERVNILTYTQLASMTSLQDVVGQFDCACILYMTRQNFGHWTALIKNPGGKQGTYEIFDSLGIPPDEELKSISDSFRVESNQQRPHLSWLVSNDMKSGRVKDVYYNKCKLQARSADVNTCGRWVAYRCFVRNLSLVDFITFFKNQRNSPDYLVTALTLLNR